MLTGGDYACFNLNIIYLVFVSKKESSLLIAKTSSRRMPANSRHKSVKSRSSEDDIASPPGLGANSCGPRSDVNDWNIG